MNLVGAGSPKRKEQKETFGTAYLAGGKKTRKNNSNLTDYSDSPQGKCIEPNTEC